PAVLSDVAIQAKSEAFPIAKAPGDRSAKAGAPPCWQIYRHIVEPLLAGRAARKSHPLLAVTEHPLGEARRLIVAINHCATTLNETLSLNPGWEIGAIHRGRPRCERDLVRGTWPSNDAIVFEVCKRKEHS
ncbi:MAG: hypothetical protein HY343_08405, partial [Lentisphaerae bacterium]|nr:hypothetical protein [Lentisphaerota bacterium]